MKLHRDLAKGFTLIELIVVISIIVLLSSVLLASLSVVRARAQNAFTVSTINQYISAVDSYFNDYGSYPTAAQGITFACLGGTGSTCFQTTGGIQDPVFKAKLQPYYKAWPDPSPTTNSTFGSGAIYNSTNGRYFVIYWTKNTSEPCLVPYSVDLTNYCYYERQ